MHIQYMACLLVNIKLKLHFILFFVQPKWPRLRLCLLILYSKFSGRKSFTGMYVQGALATRYIKNLKFDIFVQSIMKVK